MSFRKLLKSSVALLLVLTTVSGYLLMFPQTKAGATFVIDYQPYCDALYMVNLETGIVVYDKDSTKQKYPASLTKMMTCILALEYFSDPATEYATIADAVINDKVCINNGVYSTGWLRAGERVTLKDLLYCALLPSDNYAALAIAYYVSEKKGDGSLEWFVDLMNEKAQDLGCVNTHFMNPHGLYNEAHYSCAYDLYLIARHGMEMPAFADIVNETVYLRAPTNMNDFADLPNNVLRMENTNKMLSTAYDEYYYQYVKGVKTGFTSKAHHCFASYATRNGYSYICICLDDGQPTNNAKNYAMLDAKTLYQWAFTSITLKEVVNAKRPVASVNIDYAWGRDTLDLYPAKTFTTLMPSNVESYSIMVKTDVPDTISAPVTKGEKLGSAELVYGSEVIGTVDIVAGETVQRSDLLYILNGITSLFQKPLFIAIFLIILLTAVGYVVMSLMRTRSLGSMKKVHRYRKM